MSFSCHKVKLFTLIDMGKIIILAFFFLFHFVKISLSNHARYIVIRYRDS